MTFQTKHWAGILLALSAAISFLFGWVWWRYPEYPRIVITATTPGARPSAAEERRASIKAKRDLKTSDRHGK